MRLWVLVASSPAALTLQVDIVICDTSGRLHTNLDLMDELGRVHRAIGKRLAGAPHETLLVLDGTTGLNMLNQVTHARCQHRIPKC